MACKVSRAERDLERPQIHGFMARYQRKLVQMAALARWANGICKVLDTSRSRSARDTYFLLQISIGVRGEILVPRVAAFVRAEERLVDPAGEEGH